MMRSSQQLESLNLKAGDVSERKSIHQDISVQHSLRTDETRW